MKKILPIALLALLLAGSAVAQERRNLNYNQLPRTAQAFLKTYLANLSTTQITQVTDSFKVQYVVMLTNSNQVVFNRDGSWRIVSMPRASVPETIIPPSIADFLTGRFGKRNWSVTMIAKEKEGYRITANEQTMLCTPESMARMNEAQRADQEFRDKHDGMSQGEVAAAKAKRKAEHFKRLGLNPDGSRDRVAGNGARKKSNGRP